MATKVEVNEPEATPPPLDIETMTIDMVPVSKLTPYPNNPRRISDRAVKKVADAIRNFGFRQPIVADADGVVIVGHTRLMAARSLGLKKVPVHRVDETWPEWKKNSYRLADNRTHEESEWNDELLAGELASLDAEALGMTAMDRSEITALLRGHHGQTDEDSAPPVEKKAFAKPGDVWVCGDHRLICGDATSAKTVEALLGDVVPVVMVTDPPYGVNYDPGWRRDNLGAKGAATGKVKNDDRADWREAWDLFPGHVAYVWHAGLHAAAVQESLVVSGFQLRAQIVWVKQRPVISRGHYHGQHETCYYAVAEDAEDDGWRFVPEHEVASYAVTKGKSANWQGSRKQSSVWFIEHIRSETGHGTQKPVECMRRPITNNSAVYDAVYDPFMGSGTTMIAAETTGRVCYGVEIDPLYVDVAVRRWQAFVGDRAVRESDGAEMPDA